MAYYLDSSAIVKLVMDEPESAALAAAIGSDASVTSTLSRTEVLRTARRHSWQQVARAREVLAGLAFVDLGSATFDAAGLLDPPELRSLDAVHLAAALELGDDLTGLITYDQRMADAARGVGLRVVAPA